MSAVNLSDSTFQHFIRFERIAVVLSAECSVRVYVWRTHIAMHGYVLALSEKIVWQNFSLPTHTHSHRKYAAAVCAQATDVSHQIIYTH